MNASSRLSASDSSHVEDQVAYLSVERVCRAPAEMTIRLILVAIDEAETNKARRSLEDGHAVGIADDLGVVIVDDRRGDDVRAGREVDDGRCDGGRSSAGWSEAAPATDGCIDGSSVISNSVTSPSLARDVVLNC